MVYKSLSGILLENYNLIVLKNKNKPNIIYTCIYNRNFLIMIKDTLNDNKKFIINNKNYINFSILSSLTKYFSKDLFSFLNQFYKYKYFKVRFVGKGYKIKKKKKFFFYYLIGLIELVSGEDTFFLKSLKSIKCI